MSTYAIGDIQGCFTALRRLLDLLRFDPQKDRLWFVGDLVNRGPDSLAVLRFIRGLDQAAVTVLGNHDLHALAVAGGVTELRKKDSLSDLLSAPDREELLDWLRHRPLLHHENDTLLVHAGLLPSWTVAEAAAHAQEVEHVLRSDESTAFLSALYSESRKNLQWSEVLRGLPRLRMITFALTRVRVCTSDGQLDLSYKGPLDQLPEGLTPWFQFPDRKSAGTLIICGHWAAMGLRVQDNLVALDSGCVWGRRLSAIRMDDRKIFQVPCTQ